MIAALYGYEECVRIVLQAGADWTLVTTNGRTARDIAQQQNKQGVANRREREERQRAEAEAERERIRAAVEAERERQRAAEFEAENERIRGAERESQALQASQGRDAPSNNSTTAIVEFSYKVLYNVYGNHNSSNDREVDVVRLIGAPGEVKMFDDGTKFVICNLIGKGASTFALMISINRLPKVLKLSQNDDSQSLFVLDVGSLKGQDVRPFGGGSRREDYELYTTHMGVRDEDDETLDDWLQALDLSFNDYTVKTVDGKRYCVTKLHDMEREVKNKQRDLVRFSYWYHVFAAMKVAHCDVAPRNVIITFEGPIIIDYGCSVKFGEVNVNPLPFDVTPEYYMENRGTIRKNHDLKGFYVTSCEFFGLEKDIELLSKLDSRNTMKPIDVFGKYIHRSS